ncbi:MAG: EAL domain-containing protein [Pseudomonadota bacterium]
MTAPLATRIQSLLPSPGARALIGLSLLCAGVLAWLFTRADAVAPQAHYEYSQQLRALREADAEINAELLASRLELSRNYDTLVQRLDTALDTGARLLAVPDFLPATDRQLSVDAATTLVDLLEEKARLIEAFKRDNAVARNSLAIFPVQAQAQLGRWQGEPERVLARYAVNLLAFARETSSQRIRQVEIDRAAFSALRLSERQAAEREVLLRHGDTITLYLARVDSLLARLLSLDTAGRLELLARSYMHGHAHAVSAADRYRVLMYGLMILLVAFLIFMFYHLDQTRRSLARANREIGERLAAQQRAEASLRLHATAFSSAHEGITLTDAEGRILDVNPAFTRITGFERDEVIGRNPRVLKSGRHDPAFYAAMWRSITEKGSWRGEIWNRNKYGEVYPELLSISAVRDEHGALTNYVAVFADISRLKEQERQLTQMAYYDALTELPNRSLLADRIQQAMSQTLRGHGESMAVCYLDLDGFKPVNDTWGHEVGDQVLVEMAGRLRDCLRGGDTVARLGGDEFVLLLLGMHGEEECNQAIQRILRAINQPLRATPEPITLSASLGVTLYPADQGDADTLLRHADQAMYQAKQEGKHRAHLFDPEQDRDARSRLDNVSRLYEALERREFLLYYQPKVDMRQGRVVGAEALIRWFHPERGLLAPIEFLPLIEDHDLIVRVGSWVIETALAQMREWRRQGLELSVSVNIAGRQLQHVGFVQELSDLLHRFPEVAHQLELEVLETTALEDVVKVSRVIDECLSLGVNFALDDFGTGYSSLTYLKRLPASVIKIDQSFVREMLHDPHNLVIVQGILGLTSAFQRQVVAEGVESIDHGRLLLQLNCDLAQGYGISRPMPAAELPGWVAQWTMPPEWRQVGAKRWLAEDYPMLVAEVEHRNWIAQLIYAIREGLPVPRRHLTDHRHCRFSHWYDDRAARLYGHLEAYAEVAEPHRRVHQLAEAIDGHWRAGRGEEARALLQELLVERDRVLAAMFALELAVGQER